MNSDKHFNIFDELKEWSLSSNWEQYALLLLCQKGSLDEEDKKSIYNEFKLDEELEVRTEEQQIYSLDDSSIPHSSNHPEPLILSSICETIGINALVDGQTLSFGPKLNVIYGPNGSGKSGYARILKSASFTRSPDAKIYENVHILDSKPISATFLFDDGTTAKFEEERPCPQLRDNFAVFDSSCIRVYIDSKTEFDVSPYGFDIFPALADVITFIKQELLREIQAKTPEIEFFQILDSTTRIASILQSLNADTNIQELEKLQEFGENEEARMIILETAIKELHRNDPKDIITKKRQIGKDIQLLTDKIEHINKALDTDKITAIEEKLKDIKLLRELSAAASASQFAKEPMQPIGTKTWKKLIEAAIAYNSEAFPEKPFPIDSEDVRCVLCHQKLDVDAKNRLKRFFEFVHSEAENNLREGLTQLTKLQEEVEIIDLAYIGKNTAIYRTIKDSDETLFSTIDKYVFEANNMKESIIDNIKQETWNALPERPVDVIDACKNLRIKLAGEIKCLRSNSIDKEISQKEDALKYFRERKHLNKIFLKVKEAIVNYKWINKANTIAIPSPRHITDKRKELVDKLIGQNFIKRFQDECEKLDLILPATTEVKIRGSSESTGWEHNMSTHYSNTPAPSQILSEGEQTIVALADFLTEINLNNTPLGIILDDPVNSMDHLRKELIADRLAKEATVRQVIIFT
ncbi:AAA family ATPase, partial [Planctomycetota bacterium]